jgi:hypothetical protein
MLVRVDGTITGLLFRFQGLYQPSDSIGSYLLCLALTNKHAQPVFQATALFLEYGGFPYYTLLSWLTPGWSVQEDTTPVLQIGSPVKNSRSYLRTNQGWSVSA